MIPKKIAITIVADVLQAQAERLMYRTEKNPRKPAAGKAVGRREGAAWLYSECGAVRKLTPSGEVSPETVGLLAAYAAGDTGALGELEALHPAITEIPSRNYCDIVRVILS